MENGHDKEKESANSSKKTRNKKETLYGNIELSAKNHFAEVTLAFSCQGQDFLLAFSKSLYTFSFIYLFSKITFH